MIVSNIRIARMRGFTLVELMIAILLGLLISLGLVSLFSVTAKTNRVQDGLAQLQENGRYAIKRFNGDLRMTARQIMNTSGAPPTPNATNGAVYPPVTPKVYAAAINFPDMQVTAPTGWPATMTWWPLSPAYFMQGYECSTGTCSPAEPSTTLVPASSATPAATNRIAKTDVILERFINNKAEGWSLTAGEITTVCTGNVLVSIALTPVANSQGGTPFVAGDLAMLYTNFNAQIFAVGLAGGLLVPTTAVDCQAALGPTLGGAGEALLFNFSQDFITVAYYLRTDTDPNDSTRLIPTLVRVQANNPGNTTTPTVTVQPIVQGVEQLDFLYGVQYTDASTALLTAKQIGDNSNSTNCPPASTFYTQFLSGANALESNCLWRAVQTIEVHALLDSVNNQYDLTPGDRVYQYTGSSPTIPAGTIPGTTMPTGLKSGAMMRREFVALVSMRNST